MKYIFGCCCLLLAIASCSIKDETLVVGESLINSETRILFIDTLTIHAGTFKFDSLVVSDTSPQRLLVGSYKDSIFGISKSESFVQLIPTDFYIPSEAVFDCARYSEGSARFLPSGQGPEAFGLPPW